jgi:uncharacterized membrane protein
MVEDGLLPGGNGASAFQSEPAYFHNSLVHLYRGEMQRLTTWRARLDVTTHWAILLTTGITTFTLGSTLLPHYILLLGLAINTIFMIIEARRYQHLHHSKWRIQLLEHNYFAGILCPGETNREPTWRRQLGMDLETPHFTIGLFLASRLRLRRNYLMLFYFITAVWLTKIFIHPRSPSSVSEFYQRLAMGELFSSGFGAITAVSFLLLGTALVIFTPSEEVLERWSSTRRTEMSQATSHPGSSGR